MWHVRCSWVVVTLALVLAPAARAQSASGRQPTRQPFQGEFVFAEATAGLFTGIVGAWALANIGAEVLGPHGGEDPGLAGGLTGLALGLTLGTSIGVHMVARGYGFPARYFEALGGALAGMLLLPVVPFEVDGPIALIGVLAIPAVTSAVASSLGSASRVRPVAGPDADGARLGVAVEF